MTTSTKQRVLIAFSCVLVGCAVGATMPRLAAQSYPLPPGGQQWQQFCEQTQYSTSAVNAALRQRGGEGFELVSIEFPRGSSTIWTCFKRPGTP